MEQLARPVEEVAQQSSRAERFVQPGSVLLVVHPELVLPNLQHVIGRAFEDHARSHKGLKNRPKKSEGRRVELMVQKASDAFAVVEDQRPISHQQIVVLVDGDQLVLFRLVVDEVLQLLAKERRAVNLGFDG